MKNILFLLLTISAVCLCASECRSYRIPGTPDTVTLDNGLLKLTFAPGVNGALCAWEYKAQKRNIIRPLKYRVEKVDLLPDRVFTTMDGFRCRVWRSNNKIYDTMKIQQLKADPDTGCRLVMTTEQTGGLNLNLTNELQLLPGSTVLNGTVQISNPQKAAVTSSLWFNAVFFMSDAPEPVLVPVRSKVARIGKLGMTFSSADGILSELHEGNRNMYFAALRPWLAKTAPGIPGVAALKTDDPQLDKMVLYTHKSAKLHTMEILSSPERLSPGKSFSRRYQLFYFPSLTSLREIYGFYGIDLKGDTLEIESAVPSKKAVWIICGKSYQIPPLKPGILHKIKLPAKPQQPVKINIDGQNIILPGHLNYDLKSVTF